MNTARLHNIKFTVRDGTEDPEKFTGLLDGKWIRFSNDKGRTFIYNFDRNCSIGPHELLIIAEDMAGNKTEKISIYKMTDLTEGKKAPAFKALDQNGDKVSLADMKVV